MADADYASYGWWLHTAEDGTLTTSAFVDDRGTVDAASGITDLRGTATYTGGAAGNYALSSSTGGTNDAGHFTARATLEADFNNDMITGTVDRFMGADGQSRNWSIALMKSAIGDTGLIRRSDDDNSDLAADDPGAMTTWTIDGTAADAAGQWSGALKNNGDDDVPRVATGTFHSEYGTAGRMVGAFGANKQYERSAEYDTDGNIEVTIGEATTVDLTEDKDATVAANHGWEGKKYTASPTGGGMYEAVVYSNVGDQTEDEKFRVTEMADADYASYGWWLHTAEDGTLTTGAFVDDRGTVDPASGITDLRGTATYTGGAAGNYSLSSSTGGTNDAGHFTARATLEADFNNDMITGTIDRFTGADGQSRNWSVALMKSAIGDTGLIRRSDDDNSDLAADDPGAMTTWTIDGTAADAAGQWSGALKNNGDDDVPRVATGTFHSEYGTAGRMDGAFGANKQ